MAELLEKAGPVATSAAYSAVRALTELLASPLSAEDQTVQSMPDVSPTKWHRAHTSWFFETFLLSRGCAGYGRSTPSSGTCSTRTTRGSVPGTPATIGAWCPGRASTRSPSTGTTSTKAWSGCSTAASTPGSAELVELGIQHEQQHQELLLMDIKHVLSRNPAATGVRPVSPAGPGRHPVRPTWTEHHGGDVRDRPPRRRVQLRQRAPAPPRPPRARSPWPTGPVTGGEWIEFIDDGGYRRPELWLSDGWATVRAEGWERPALLDPGGRRVARVHPGRDRPGQPRRAGLPRQLLRGRRLRPLGRAPAARPRPSGRWPPSRRPVRGPLPRSRPSSTRRRPAPAGERSGRTALRRRVAVDLLVLQPLPGLRTAPRGRRRVQRQVHGQPVRAAGRLVRDPAGPRPGHLPQLLPPSARWAFCGLRLARNS